MKQIEIYMKGVREQSAKYLRENVPEIQRLESLDDLHDLTLTEQKEVEEILFLEY